MQQQAVLAPCAVLVGVLIGVKLLFGRRKQSRHNKKQQQKNRDLDVEDILSFKSGQQQKPQVEAYEAPKTTAESLSKEYTFQETLVAPEDISKGISPDDVHTDYEHINDHVFVEFNIVDDDYVYVLTHQTDIPPPELHLSASSSYLQDQSASPADKVAVSYVIDSDNQVQVLINNKVENKRGVSFEKSVNVAQIACTEGLRSKDVQANMDQTDYLVGVFFNIREDDYVALVLIDMQNKQVQQIEEGEADSMFVETSSQTTQFSIPEAVPVLPEKGSEQETIEEVPAFYTDKENIKPSSAREAAAAVETLERVPHVPDSSFDDDDENKAFNQNRAQVVPASQDFDSDIILEKAEAQQTGNQDNVSGQQQTQGQELQVNSAREISAQLQKQEQSIEVPVDVIEDSAAGGQGDTSEPKTENQIEGEDAQAEQEELGECEKRAQEIVGMANQLWGKGTPVEIKRAIKMQRAALDTLQEGGGRPVYVAQVASSLADMQYALNDLQETRDTLQIALTAATETGDMAHMSKLSNNLGQVLRKLNNFEAAKKLHSEYLEIFEPAYGVGHHYTCLTRQNLVETLEGLDQLQEASDILERSTQTCIAAIQEIEQGSEDNNKAQEPQEENVTETSLQKEQGQQEDELHTTPDALIESQDQKQQNSPANQDGNVNDDDQIEGDGIYWTYICSGRVLAEQARFELAHYQDIGSLSKAEELLRLALQYIEKGEGADGDSSATPLSYLGKILCTKGGEEAFAEAYDAYERLRKISATRDGEKSQSVAMVLHTEAEVLSSLERHQDAVDAEEQAIEILRGLLKQKYHIGLIKHFEVLAKVKQAAGDENGAQLAMRDILLCKQKHQQEQMKLKRTTSARQSSSKQPTGQSSSNKRGKKKKGK